MTATTIAEDLAIQPVDTPVKLAKTPIWQKFAPGVVLLISFFVNFYNLGQNGFGNLYYAAGVRSMADSWHNFFFASYDPGGFVTLDKPPLGFWLQVISVKIFGFSPFAVLFPQALAGVISVLVLYLLVRRHFGFTAALLASLALAVSPLSVATNRDATIDSTLVLILLLGAWAIIKAAESGRWRWLLLSTVLVGIGFNIKTLQAYLVLPAFGLLYLLAAPRKFWMRVGQLVVALLVLLAVSLSWSIAVDMTPASQRPYVGPSQNNSELDLTFDYNGLQHLSQSTTTSDTNTNSIAGRIIGIIVVPIAFFTPFISGQITWFLPVAFLALFVPRWRRHPHLREDRSQLSWLFWRVWLVTLLVFFGVTNAFYLYYMTTLMPAVCALFGIGIVTIWQDYRSGKGRGWLLSFALLFTATAQISIIAFNPAWGNGLVPVIALLTALTLLVVFASRLKIPHITALSSRIHLPMFSLAVAALFLTPTLWSVIPILQNRVTVAPRAGPDQSSFIPVSYTVPSTTVDAKLVRYLEAHQGATKYLVATVSSGDAGAFIITTNKPVMALGGFAGSDSILTPASVQTLVTNHTVRFFYLNSAVARVGVAAHDTVAAKSFPIANWVDQNCSMVPADNWSSSPPPVVPYNGTTGVMQLFDCAGA